MVEIDRTQKTRRVKNWRNPQDELPPGKVQSCDKYQSRMILFEQDCRTEDAWCCVKCISYLLIQTLLKALRLL